MATKIGNDTKVFLKDGMVLICPPESNVTQYKNLSELHGITSININIAVNKIITANIDLWANFEEIHAVPIYSMYDPINNEMKEVNRIEFTDGTTWKK